MRRACCGRVSGSKRATDELRVFERNVTVITRHAATIALAAALALAAGAARAGLDDEYKEGELAYRRGDVVRAMEVLKKAADAGHAKAQALYAEILDLSDFDAEAIEYYRKSVAQGEAAGQYGLGAMLAAGEGIKRDPKEAWRLFLSAAEKGNTRAIRAVANALVTGELELDDSVRNGPDAAAWLTRAAEQDHLPAVEALVRAYQSGGYGLAPDAQKAAQWTEKLNKLRPPKPKRR